MNTARYLTDEEIIGDLRRRILNPEPLNIPPLSDIHTAKVKQAVEFAEVKEYTRQTKEKPHRVPRAWWGWIIPVVHKLDEALKEV